MPREIARGRVTDPVILNQIATLKKECSTGYCYARKNKDGSVTLQGEDELRVSAGEFMNLHAESIINMVGGNALSDIDKARILETIGKLDIIPALLFVISFSETSDVKALASENFLNGIESMNSYIAGSLLFEISYTGDTKSLTDNRMFGKEALSFFNTLGTEAASEWFYSMARTGNVDALTDSRAMSTDVLSVINGDGSVARELSFAIGDIGLAKIVSQQFLGSLKGMDLETRKEYLSAVCCQRREDQFKLMAPALIQSVISGREGAWDAAERIGYRAEAQTILIANTGNDGHDYGVKLVIKDLIANGYNVKYLAGANNAGEIASVAAGIGAVGIGIGVANDSYSRIVTDVSRIMSVKGYDGVAIFTGGVIAQASKSSFLQQGISVFSQGADIGGVAKLLNRRNDLSVTSVVGIGAFSAGSYAFPMSATIIATGGYSTAPAVGDINVYIKSYAPVLPNYSLYYNLAKDAGVPVPLQIGAGVNGTISPVKGTTGIQIQPDVGYSSSILPDITLVPSAVTQVYSNGWEGKVASISNALGTGTRLLTVSHVATSSNAAQVIANDTVALKDDLKISQSLSVQLSIPGATVSSFGAAMINSVTGPQLNSVMLQPSLSSSPMLSAASTYMAINRELLDSKVVSGSSSVEITGLGEMGLVVEPQGKLLAGRLLIDVARRVKASPLLLPTDIAQGYGPVEDAAEAMQTLPSVSSSGTVLLSVMPKNARVKAPRRPSIENGIAYLEAGSTEFTVLDKSNFKLVTDSSQGETPLLLSGNRLDNRVFDKKLLLQNPKKKERSFDWAGIALGTAVGVAAGISLFFPIVSALSCL